MSYTEIFIFGWNLNLLMFFLNLFIGIKSSIDIKTKEQLVAENKMLIKLKTEFEKYYPYRKYEILASYFIPFTAFFRICYRLIELRMFFKKNIEATLFDYMVYKYENDIKIAKSKID